jgi:hypothetical protein
MSTLQTKRETLSEAVLPDVSTNKVKQEIYFFFSIKTLGCPDPTPSHTTCTNHHLITHHAPHHAPPTTCTHHVKDESEGGLVRPLLAELRDLSWGAKDLHVGLGKLDRFKPALAAAAAAAVVDAALQHGLSLLFTVLATAKRREVHLGL